MNYKKLSIKQLKNIFQDIQFQTTPFHRQFVTLAWLAENPKAMLWHDIGSGKTLCALYAIEHLWFPKKTLIVCPNSITVTVWKEHIQEHTKLSCKVLTGDTKKRKELLLKNDGLFIINYEALYLVFGETYKVNDKKLWFVNQDLIKNIDIDCIVFDEIHKLRNGGAKVTEIAHTVAKQSNYVVGMTGSPMAKDELDLWAEYWVVTDGEAFGKQSYYRFKNENTIVVDKRRIINGVRVGPKWLKTYKVDENKKQEI